MNNIQTKDRQSSFRIKLELIRDSEPNTIRSCVATEALEHRYDDLSGFFKDLLTNGCISGMVNQLIYYVDTRAFYDKHYIEIEELREEYEDSVGEPLQIRGDLKNWFAWFAFEETARHMNDELELDL